MTAVHGFRLVTQRTIKELETEAFLYEHDVTGTQLLSLVNRDENKVFGVTFRTPPADSTGIAHILEHSVLCGSRKYPVKEPFVNLLKSSLKTFLNAFTYPDKTCYPVASQNVRDFYNLIDVYLDAVFHPLLTPEVLMQEGWHLEAESEESALTYQGVVYGEMKGVFSSPDSLLGRHCQHSVFPDNAYGLESGGDPEEIPNLTFAQFEDFHARYYHPSNARFFFSGDDDPQERLRILNEALKDFDRREVDSQIALQPRFEAPRRVEKHYAVSSDAGASARAMVAINWLLPETRDVELNLALQILVFILTGMSASPLRKALIDSGLGEDLVDGGLETELRQMYFSTGLKGVEPNDTAKVEGIVFGVLQDLAEKGIDKELIGAAVNTMEFALRERNTGGFPQGLSSMLQAMTNWLHGNDPLTMLAFEAPLERVKHAVAGEDRFLERLVQHHFVDNPHRTTVVLLPDPELGRKEEEAERARLALVASKMGIEDRRRIMQEAAALKVKQQAPDSAEAAATIPRLALADMPRENKRIHREIRTLGTVETPVHVHALPTSGIAYVDVGFDLRVLPQSELPLVPLFARALLGTGTDKEDFASLSRRISATTGGIWTESFASAVSGTTDTAAWLFVRGKAMASQTANLTAILADVFRAARYDDRQRVRQLLLEDKARLEQAVIPSGHGFVDSRLRSSFGTSEWLNEQLGGISSLFFLRTLLEEVDRDWPAVQARLARIAALLFNQRNMLLNATVDREAVPAVLLRLEELVDGLPSFDRVASPWHPEVSKGNEGLSIPAQVNFVGKAANLHDLGYRFHGSALVITKYLRTTWLWDRIRVQGGAYGAFCRLNRITGVFGLVSYRDPNLDKTLQIFDDAAQFLRTVALSTNEIEQSVIGTIGDLDAYMLPDAKGHVSLVRALTGQSDEELDRIRGELLETREEHFREFGNLTEALREVGRVVVLGGVDGLDKAVAGGLKLDLLKVM